MITYTASFYNSGQVIQSINNNYNMNDFKFRIISFIRDPNTDIKKFDNELIKLEVTNNSNISANIEMINLTEKSMEDTFLLMCGKLQSALVDKLQNITGF